jgi:tetraacyldisaccharide 4'-kinase
MTGVAHRAVHDWWAGGGGVAGKTLMTLAAPLEWAYASAVRRRNRRHDRETPERVSGMSVISVGNLVVGGTGKTPFASWVVRAAEAAGAAPAVVMRGYGEDEPLLHRAWHPGLPVVADPNRVAGVRAARSQGANLAVLDDGFQHRRVARDLDIVLVAAEDPLPGRLLPRGPYREPLTSLERADVVVVTRRTADPARAGSMGAAVRDSAPGVVLGIAALVPHGWRDLWGSPTIAPEGPVVVATGIARPGALAENVADLLGTEPELVAFPDHHRFSPRDAVSLRTRAGERTIVTTEKDAVKLQSMGGELGRVAVLTQRLSWEEGEAEVRQRIDAVTKEPRP